MAHSETHPRFLNPWVLHLQKLGLELKCPFCLDLYNKPVLLPCNHIFCSSCIPKSGIFGSECPLCKVVHADQDLRLAPFMENVVNIYRSLDASFSKHLLNSGMAGVSTKSNYPDQMAKRAIDSSCLGNLTNDHCSIQPTGTKRVQASNDSHLARATSQDHESVGFEMKQVELSPDSPPSSGISKGVEVDGRDPGSGDDTAEKCAPNKSTKRNANGFGQESINEDHDVYLKKQKQLHEGPQKMQEGHSPQSTSNNMENSTSTNNDLKISTVDQQVVEFDSASLVNFTCAFCQTWKATEATGPIQHFANGKQIFGSDVGRSNVIHVHKSCIEWAPQIFYESDTVIRNLEKELARAVKLKCTSCGLKGAALGCYAKTCRRTYHVPCAYGIAKCRWDSDEFLMLCPSHSSQKFPSEKYKKLAPTKCTTTKTQIYDEEKDLHEFDFWASSPTGAQNWVLCGSALSADEKLMLVKFAKLCGATVTKTWNPRVTHVIAATEANGACSRTLKVLMAILKGRWILKTDWISACMQLKSPVDEEPYEISLDNHGCSNGPKTGRLRALNNAPQLFSGLKFLFTGNFVPTYKNDIENLIIAAGGKILDDKEQLLQCSGYQATSSSTSLIIYNGDAMMVTEDGFQGWSRQEEAERLAFETGSQVIAHTWILDSISLSKCQPLSR